MTQRLSGVGVTPAAGVGTAVWYTSEPDRSDLASGDAGGTGRDTVDVDADSTGTSDTAGIDVELERFEAARDAARDAIGRERERAAERLGDSEAAVFDAHVQFLDDPQVAEGVEARVGDGMSADRAVEEAFAAFIDRFEGMDDRTAARADDLRDVRDRLLRRLAGEARADIGDLPAGSVVLADRLTPSDTVRLDPESVAGFATAAGGRTAHAAIFARALGVPAVVGVGEALHSIDADTTVVVDGAEGEVVVDPDAATRDAVGSGTSVEVRRDPVTTAGGTRIEVAANVGRSASVAAATEHGADGIGLFRTEVLRLDRDSPPDEAEQYRIYRDALATFPDGRVVVRTFDSGGDKPVGPRDGPGEANPFLGERGIRRSLGPDADAFETQLRALVRAAGAGSGGTLSVLLPMVSTVEEVVAARETMESVAADLGVGDHALPELGVMIETPAAALIAAELVDHVDFLSIGTNDLTQYVMAAERGNHRVAELADPRHPAVLRAIRSAVAATEDTDAWVGLCGEMASDPAMTELLVGLGIEELSVAPVAVPRVKRAVTEVRDGAARQLAERALAAGTREAVERAIRDDGE